MARRLYGMDKGKTHVHSMDLNKAVQEGGVLPVDFFYEAYG